MADKIPSVVKIDVEGAEYDVVSGMEDIFQEEKPTLFIEVHNDLIRNLGATPDDLFDTLREQGYVFG